MSRRAWIWLVVISLLVAGCVLQCRRYSHEQMTLKWYSSKQANLRSMEIYLLAFCEGEGRIPRSVPLKRILSAEVDVSAKLGKQMVIDLSEYEPYLVGLVSPDSSLAEQYPVWFVQGGCVIYHIGPDMVFDLHPDAFDPGNDTLDAFIARAAYDPTNGAISRGDIVRRVQNLPLPDAQRVDP